MNASFEEKSVWIQLSATTLILGGYFAVAWKMYASGVTELAPYAPVFLVAVVLLVAVLVGGHIVAAVTSRPEGRDERDRLIEWRAESNSSWILAVGVLTAITCMVLALENVWIAHMLLLSLLLSEQLRFVLQILYYRRGI